MIARRNDGGMAPELHNNTSPDDVVICQCLLKTLNDNGITKERLLSYDRAIHSEPSFRGDQKDGLLRDLGHYMRTLKAVHSGADLESAIANCMGYKAEGQGFMVGVQINPIPGLPSGFPELLRFVLEHVEERNVEALLEGSLEARQELRPLSFKSSDRLKDMLFLDIALDSTVRTAIERDDNEDLVYCLKGWHHSISMCKSQSAHWALYAKSVLDRTRLALASKVELYQRILQPSTDYLGSLLGVDQWAISIFTEEIIRAGSAATLSTLVNRLDPVLRETAHLGSWQVISPVEVVGYVDVVDELLSVQNKSYDRPTILVAKSIKGEEEIPDGAVAVLTPDMPDVLSHVSVRAKNCKVCFATCFDPNILADLQAKKGKLLRLKPSSADVVYSYDFALSDSRILQQLMNVILRKDGRLAAINERDVIFVEEKLQIKEDDDSAEKSETTQIHMENEFEQGDSSEAEPTHDEQEPESSEALTTLRVVLTMCATLNLHLEQLDVKTTFLHGNLEKEIYMLQPEGFKEKEKKNLVCMLNKSLFGLKQAPRCWYKRFDSFIICLGYNRLNADPCAYFKRFGDNDFVILLLYVDDMLVAGSNKDHIEELKAQLAREFEMKDLGSTNKILGIQIHGDRSNRKIWLSQKNYLKKILSRFNMQDLGSLMFTMICTRLDIAQTMRVVSRQSALHLARNPTFHSRTKHIRVQYHFICEKVKEETVDMQKIYTKDNIADFMMKAINADKFTWCRSSCGLSEIEVKEGELPDSSSSDLKGDVPSSITLVRKQFGGKYAISAEEFTPEMVGAKSRNISYLKGKVPSWVGIPTSVALPFAVFEKVIADKLKKEVDEKLQILKKKLGDTGAFEEIRKTVLQLRAPPQLVQELKTKMQSSGMTWPGDEGEQRWEQAWTAIKKVWASKWNERAYFSTRKVKLDHDYLYGCPGDLSEIYTEAVKGLGETLVGAYPGRALSFVCKKNNLNSPQNMITISTMTSRREWFHYYEPISGGSMYSCNDHALEIVALVVLKGEKIAANLYMLKGETLLEAEASVASCSSDSAMLRHHKLGHIKHRRLKFNTSNSRGKSVLELVHSDVWQEPVTSLSGAKYFVSFIDDCSRRYWVYPIKKKSDVFSTFKNFKARVELDSGNKIKCFRTDNGGEYTSEEFDDFCRKEGIKRQFTVANTPKKNEVSERMNRTLLERTRAMLRDAGLEKSFWAEAVNTACYLVNRAPSTAIELKTPMEMWNGKPVDYSNLHVFGSIVYVMYNSQEISKLDPKSRKCKFLGYADGVKGYRLWDPTARKVIINRDVIFVEDKLQRKEDDDSAEKLETTQIDVENEVEQGDSSEAEPAHDEQEPESSEAPTTQDGEPSIYQEAINSSDVSLWMMAMQEEIEALNKNNTWDLVTLPQRRKPIGNKWVFKIKRNDDDQVERYCARLVVKGYAQKKEQLDVKTTFLNGNLEEEIYMLQPEGFEEKEKKNLVCRLNKSLYGLKQASRCWYKRFDSFIMCLGYNRLNADPCAYFKRSGDNDFVILLLYVDDMLVAGPKKDHIEELKAQLAREFEMKDLGSANKILGMQIHRDRSNRKIWLSQKNYLKKILSRFNMQYCKPISTPLPINFKLSSSISPSSKEERMEMSRVPYASAVGSLMFAMICTRLDIAQGVGVVSRYMANPGKEH
ncbi:Alpha-glucan water dikinase [Hibiscus syriacus]|uniref:Alpha-glucan water dikinase n=1 Tax=Hibiscus syriacus TaxID=106335 RepID=A0A6A3A3U8_HIBSY|nr:Alpha-glucan water dikinase [Hibiscus syriacus]